MRGREIGTLLLCLTISGCTTGLHEGSLHWLRHNARIEFREDCKDYLIHQRDYSLAHASQTCSRASWAWAARQNVHSSHHGGQAPR